MDNLQYKRIVFSENDLKDRIQLIGRQIMHDYADQDLVLVGVLKGSFYFLADLTRAIDMPVGIDFISIGVYPGSTSQTGVVRITKDLDLDVSGKHVLIVEDITRTGLTTGYLVQNIEARQPKSVKVCSLLINPSQQLINVPIEYYGFEVSDTWMMGYGMDIDEKWRNLPYVVEVEKTNRLTRNNH